MNIIDIIEKKKDGNKLSYEELEFSFNGYMKDEVKDYQMSSLLMAICINGMDEEEVFNLTDLFIKSGNILDLSSIPGIKVDKHSTGGVGDKVTLVVGPIVSSLGIPFAKMCGRGLGYTGGTIDKLESIPGFNVSLSEEEFIKQVKNISIAITSQTKQLTPMDKKIYALRDITGTAKSIPLIASSVMSKKIASGADKILIDITLGSGALINKKIDALYLSDLMIKIGKKYNREVRTIITDMNSPLGKCIGNSLEVKEAMDILQGKGEGYIVEVCKSIASELVSMGKNIDIEEAKKLVEMSINSGSAYNKFLELINYQHGNINKLTVSDRVFPIKSVKSGILKEIDCYKIGIISARVGVGKENLDDVLDYGAGIVLDKKLGDYINKDDLLCTIYLGKSRDNSSYNDILDAFIIE